jgi:methionyl aminopeptidase
MSVVIHSLEDFEKMRKAGSLAASVLDYIAPFVQPGITTEALDKLCHDYIIARGATPAPLNYNGFPKSICTSINHVVCHGIPDNRKLKDGDIINIDVTVILDGWHGDTSRMFYVGNKVGIKAKRLVQAAYEAMMLGISQVKPGATLGDVGHAMEQHALKNGFSVVRDYTGHGIGRVFHAKPEVLNYGKPGEGMVIKEGMFFTVEPMLNEGSHEVILSQVDGWTVTTKDKLLSAQFEHTVGVTKDGCEIFTRSCHPPYD